MSDVCNVVCGLSLRVKVHSETKHNLVVTNFKIASAETILVSLSFKLMLNTIIKLQSYQYLWTICSLFCFFLFFKKSTDLSLVYFWSLVYVKLQSFEIFACSMDFFCLLAIIGHFFIYICKSLYVLY